MYTQSEHEAFCARMDQQAEQFRRDLAELKALEDRCELLELKIAVTNEILKFARAA
jgi:hypothetical protein